MATKLNSHWLQRRHWLHIVAAPPLAATPGCKPAAATDDFAPDAVANGVASEGKGKTENKGKPSKGKVDGSVQMIMEPIAMSTLLRPRIGGEGGSGLWWQQWQQWQR